MDEGTFQQELIQLKQRVSEMAAAYAYPPSRSLPRPCENDAFFAQLIDAKAHLDSLQSMHNGPQRLALPSAPLFWSLFNSLRTDVRSLDTRVSDLEQNVSTLEDRVDQCLDPVTPTGSAADASGLPAWNASQDQHNAGDSATSLAKYTRPPYVPTVHQHSRQKPSGLDASHDHTELFCGAEHNNTGDHHSSTSQQEALVPEGLAYRDKEIAGLEERMRSMQDRVRRGEEASSRRESHTQDLEIKNAELERILFDRENSLAAYSDILGERQADLDRLQSECHSKDAALWNLQQNYLRKKGQLSAVNRQLHQLQHALYDLQASKQDDIQELTHVKDEEIRRLRVVCESKETVVAKQDEVIAQGASLMEQKDEEFEQVTRELKVLKDDLAREVRDRQRITKLFEEKCELVVQLSASLHQALLRQVKNKDVQTSQFRSGLMAPATKWTPKPLTCAQLPDEQRRAAIWQNGPRSASYTFGKPGWTDNDDSRRSDSVRLLERLALMEEGVPEQQREVRGASGQQAQRPRPAGNAGPAVAEPQLHAHAPAPAPLTGRQESTGNIDGGARARERAGSTVKHRSMQELPRCQVQA